MPSDSIVSDQSSAVNQSTRLRASIDGYSSLVLQKYSNATADIPGSRIHDAVISSFQDTLRDWKVLIYSDADAVRDTGLVFSEVDKGIASKLLGIGS